VVVFAILLVMQQNKTPDIIDIKLHVFQEMIIKLVGGVTTQRLVQLTGLLPWFRSVLGR
jgi:hypothetical protein